MKLPYLLTIVLAAAVGAVVGSFTSQHNGVRGPSVAIAENTDDQARIIEAVRHTTPSVVALQVTANGTRILPTNPLSALLGGAGGAKIVPFHERASGSGFVYDKNGLILTDDHVVHGAQQITAVFNNGDKVKAHIFGEDPDNDIALVKVDNYAKLPQPLELADSNSIQIGEWTIAIGEPLELQQTVTVGVASAIGRNEQITTDTGQQRSFKNLMQTSAPINPGNSGGPLINIDGQVIAINQSVAAPAQGIGFAVPANTIKNSIALIEKHPGVNNTESGFLGVQLAPINERVKSALHYNGNNGAAVAGVISGSPAANAGLKVGDVIQSIDGNNVGNAQQAVDYVSHQPPGKDVKLHVWSKGHTHDVNVKLTQRPVAE